MAEREESSARIIGIVRHRLCTDGKGVTTLVGFWGCPLRCRYCLNPHSTTNENQAKNYTPKDLYEEVLIDQLYFLATGGGITFGGGEPLLHPDFIREFRNLCGEHWNITLETSLNTPLAHLQKTAPSVNNYIIDIKETHPEIYERYTGKENRQVADNLEWLAKNVNPESITVRIPLIPHFNTEADNERSEKIVRNFGIQNIDRFAYQEHVNKPQPSAKADKANRHKV